MAIKIKAKNGDITIENVIATIVVAQLTVNPGVVWHVPKAAVMDAEPNLNREN